MPALADTDSPGQGDAARWSDLRKRVLSAAVLAPVVLYAIWVGGLPYSVLMLAAAAALAWEWVSLCGGLRAQLPGVIVMVAVVAGAFAAVLDYPGAGLAILAAGAAIAAAFAGGGAHWRALAAGVPYAGVGVVALIWLRADAAAGLTNLLFLLLLVWASDIGAYVTGRLVGGPKLAPRISPGKTRSGAVGGLVAAVCVALVVAYAVQGTVQPGRVAAIAAGLGIVAQAGDLLESMIKRHFGVKDSGTLIPGHGGLLDRVDALLTAAPVAALLALAAGPGVVLWQ